MPRSPRSRSTRIRGAMIQALEQRLLLSASPARLPYMGTPQGVPGTIEMENYDTGGEGVSFHDPVPTVPSAYRHDAIDVQAASDAGGGYAVGSTTAGEWLNYTVNVAASTVYTLSFRVASGSAGGTIHVNVDGANATGAVQIAGTGGWQNWTTVNVANVPVPAGQHVLTLSIDSAAAAGASVANFNWLQFTDTPATSPRTQWWRDAKFGMFIHWGLYSQLAGHWNGQTTSGLGEWIMNDLNIPLSQYAQVANQFDPTLFNAQQWVKTAQSAGMKYVVMTAKHHDGFSMFNTSVNNYNVVADTPWHQDPIALMSQATHAAGLHFGVYYSILNWADPNASAAGIDKYMVTMETQLKELVTNDHPDILWFDGEWPSWWTEERGRELTEFVRNLNPALIINDRIGKRLPTDGDFTTPEQLIPTNEPSGRLWETCMTLNDTWGYKDTDNDWKSASTIVSDLKQIEAAGGNYLLNVGPTGQGIIPAPAVQILQQVGQALGVTTGGSGGGTSGGGGGSGGSGGTGGTPTGGSGGTTSGGTGGTTSGGTGGTTTGGSGGTTSGGTGGTSTGGSGGTTSGGTGGTTTGGSSGGTNSGGTGGTSTGSTGSSGGTNTGATGSTGGSTTGGAGSTGATNTGGTGSTGDPNTGSTGSTGGSNASGGTGSGGLTNPPPGSSNPGGQTAGSGNPAPAASTTTMSFSAKHKAVYVDRQGHRIIVSLRGPGAGQLVFVSGDADVSQVLLSGTSIHSILSIRGRTDVGEVTAASALGSLSASAANLAGDVSVSGDLRRLQASGAAGGHTISASTIGSIVLRGNLSDDVQAGTIGRVSVGGALSGSSIRATGSIGTVIASAASASEVFAGVSPGLNTLPAGASDFADASASIRSFVVRGHGAFSDTRIAAPQIRSASLGAVQLSNDGNAFGVAAHQLRSLRAIVSGKPKALHNLTATAALGGDAVARIV